MAATFTIGSGIAGGIAEKGNKQVIICVSIFMTGISLYLASGLKIESEVLTWLGLGIMGLFVAGVIIPMIPLIICSTETYL